MKDGNVYGEGDVRKTIKPEGRVCKFPECKTILSIYNLDSHCYKHSLKILDKKIDAYGYHPKTSKQLVKSVYSEPYYIEEKGK